MLTFTEKFALVAVAGVVAGVVVWVQWYFPRPTFTPKCTTDILEVQKALDQSSRARRKWRRQPVEMRDLRAPSQGA